MKRVSDNSIFSANQAMTSIDGCSEYLLGSAKVMHRGQPFSH
ncbi:MAG: hypothetical protein ACI814_005188 [Mariniblastus sp.]